MSGLKVVKIPDGDYKLITRSAGTITLDTGTRTGTVYITGDLNVMGTTTTVQSETTTIKDNIIFINSGESGSGVSALGTSAGLQIDRGSLTDVSFLFDETVSSYNPNVGASETGTFVFRDVDLNLKPIATNSINTDGGNLALISDGIGIVTVKGTTNYEEQVLDYTTMNSGISLDIATVARASDIATVETTTPHGLVGRATIICDTDASFNATDIEITVLNSVRFSYANAGSSIGTTSVTGKVYPTVIYEDDTIPNMRAVADYVSYALGSGTIALTEIKENDTSVSVSDFDTSGVSEINFTVDGSIKAVINNSGLTVDTVQIMDNAISHTGLSDTIALDSVLAIKNKASIPATPVGYINLYGSTPGNGGTGLYFVNTDGTNDEMISKTKALLYALIL